MEIMKNPLVRCAAVSLVFLSLPLALNGCTGEEASGTDQDLSAVAPEPEQETLNDDTIVYDTVVTADAEGKWVSTEVPIRLGDRRAQELAILNGEPIPAVKVPPSVHGDLATRADAITTASCDDSTSFIGFDALAYGLGYAKRLCVKAPEWSYSTANLSDFCHTYYPYTVLTCSPPPNPVCTYTSACAENWANKIKSFRSGAKAGTLYRSSGDSSDFAPGVGVKSYNDPPTTVKLQLRCPQVGPGYTGDGVLYTYSPPSFSPILCPG